jgi:transposase, IS5 family
MALDHQLATFLQRTRHVCGTARRRVFGGETVPNSEKLFSIFEPHTQLYIRGKAGHPLQFGRVQTRFAATGGSSLRARVERRKMRC